MECLLPYLCMMTVPHIMVGLERTLDYRGVGLARFHCSLHEYVQYTKIDLPVQYLMQIQRNLTNLSQLVFQKCAGIMNLMD